SRLYKAVVAIDSKAVIDASEKKKSELPAMIRQLAGNYRISLSYDGAAKIADLVGGSTVALNSEVKKLASYVLALGKNEANLEDVVAVVSRSQQPSSWDFVDAFSRRDLAKSLNTLNALQSETPVSLLYLCVIRLRELLHFKSLVTLGDRDIAKALNKPDWQIRRLEPLAAKYESSELRDLLAKAAHADMRMKSGEDAKMVLQELILASCQ
ncbi:MAG: DNA polymerase III subunit delta, partial [Coriobacteriia bacterium]|nr:DNA polymerase III subunit delta [Coriobacteriia bacterium]